MDGTSPHLGYFPSSLWLVLHGEKLAWSWRPQTDHLIEFSCHLIMVTRSSCLGNIPGYRYDFSKEFPSVGCWQPGQNSLSHAQWASFSSCQHSPPLWRVPLHRASMKAQLSLHLCLRFLKRKHRPNWHHSTELPLILQWTQKETRRMCTNRMCTTSEGSHHLESRAETWDRLAQPNMLLLSKQKPRPPKEHTDGMLGDVTNTLPNGSRYYFGRCLILKMT